MIIEILCEDKSSVPILERIVPRILTAEQRACLTVEIHPHRGKGYLPRDLLQKPRAFANGLLDLLPAKLRAYDSVYASDELIIAVILDADQESPDELYRSLEYTVRSQAPDKLFVIGICVEETEAWLLGDEEALFSAFPEADRSVYAAYEQDSVCNTWEVLARVILGDAAERLIKVGYPAVGQYKHEWADAISAYMEIEANRSDSFQRFVAKFGQVAAWGLERGESGGAEAAGRIGHGAAEDATERT